MNQESLKAEDSYFTAWFILLGKFIMCLGDLYMCIFDAWILGPKKKC